MGERLGYQVLQLDDFPPIIQWVSANNNTSYHFLISASALLGKFFKPKKSKYEKIITDITWQPGELSGLQTQTKSLLFNSGRT